MLVVLRVKKSSSISMEEFFFNARGLKPETSLFHLYNYIFAKLTGF
jgi:hypothetical protein